MDRNDIIEVFDLITNEISDLVVSFFEKSRQRGRILKASSHIYPLQPRSKADILSSTLYLREVSRSNCASRMNSRVRYMVVWTLTAPHSLSTTTTRKSYPYILLWSPLILILFPA